MNEKHSESEKTKKSVLQALLVKIAFAVMACMLVVGGYIVYQLQIRMNAMKKAAEQFTEMTARARQKAAPEEIPFARPEKELRRSSQAPPGRMLIKKTTFSGYPFDELSSGEIIENAQRIDRDRLARAMKKYANRPIVREIMEDLKKDPVFSKAFDKNATSNPSEVLKIFGSMGMMNKIAAKYAMRPEFLKLMMEVMSDPEMKNLFSGLFPSQFTEMAEPATGKEVSVDTSVFGGAGTGVSGK